LKTQQIGTSDNIITTSSRFHAISQPVIIGIVALKPIGTSLVIGLSSIVAVIVTVIARPISWFACIIGSTTMHHRYQSPVSHWSFQ
jgi:hypothetical protein